MSFDGSVDDEDVEPVPLVLPVEPVPLDEVEPVPLDEDAPVPLALLPVSLGVDDEDDDDDGEVDEGDFDEDALDEGEVPGVGVVEDDEDEPVDGDGTTVVDDDEVAGGELERSPHAATPSVVVAARATMSRRFMGNPLPD